MIDIRTGDCLEVLRTLADNSVDAIVTDPPYGLSFMGNRWDYDVPSEAVWREGLRVLKPGGHLLAFAGTRTQHRMAVRIEDAGFEIRDMIAWVYGSGFPKSHNGEWGGTALKPALEPITMARKPLTGTVAENVLAHGTGALNIDGCRVGDEILPAQMAGQAKLGTFERKDMLTPERIGRWPANVIHDGSDEVLAGFPATKGGVAVRRNSGGNTFGGDKAKPQMDDLGYGDTGSAARFFYCAKASRTDRNEGCESLPLVDWTDGAPNNVRADQINTTTGERRNARPSRNHHPTVKPTDLMRYLCRLVTPPGGVVLDPFMGSGSTGKAAVLEGFQFIGIEINAGYAEIARRRVYAAAQETMARGRVGRIAAIDESRGRS